MVAKPPVITAWISDLNKKRITYRLRSKATPCNAVMIPYFVMSGRKGLMSSGASVCPRNMLAAAFMLSAAVVPTVTYSSQPKK
jgi:hypothetical protein